MFSVLETETYSSSPARSARFLLHSGASALIAELLDAAPIQLMGRVMGCLGLGFPCQPSQCGRFCGAVTDSQKMLSAMMENRSNRRPETTASMNLPDFSNGVPRAVALDLDGTALNSSSRLSTRTSSAVLALVDTEMPIVIATARPERVIPVLTGPEIAARCSLVHLSGAAAVGRHPLSGSAWNPIDPSQAIATWDIVSKSAIPCRMTMETDGRRFAVSHEGDADELWTLNTATPDMILSLDEAMASGPAKVSINGLGNDLSTVVERLREDLADRTMVIPSLGNSFINVHSARASKSGALATLLEPIGIELSEVISFGDDLPDVDLMVNTGWPVAVANAIAQVKAAARFHTASNDDDGVAMVLEGLLEAVSNNGD